MYSIIKLHSKTMFSSDKNGINMAGGLKLKIAFAIIKLPQSTVWPSDLNKYDHHK